jgi:predicted TIM-barrel fold metal-dependent hydrolase
VSKRRGASRGVTGRITHLVERGSPAFVAAGHVGQFVGVETEVGWIPPALEYLDNFYWRNRTHTGVNIKELPSFYFERQVFATFEQDTFGVAQRHRLGVDNLMWATDYPHPDSTWPNSQKVLETHFSDVPVEEARLMIGGNAARVYGL